jgi:hypothetical protein
MCKLAKFTVTKGFGCLVGREVFKLYLFCIGITICYFAEEKDLF